MEFLIPILRIIHFLGLGLLLGGIVSSLVLVKKTKSSMHGALAAWNCMHLVAAPGLVLLIISGILQSQALYWENFKGLSTLSTCLVFLKGIIPTEYLINNSGNSLLSIVL